MTDKNPVFNDFVCGTSIRSSYSNRTNLHVKKYTKFSVRRFAYLRSLLPVCDRNSKTSIITKIACLNEADANLLKTKLQDEDYKNSGLYKILKKRSESDKLAVQSTLNSQVEAFSDLEEKKNKNLEKIIQEKREREKLKDLSFLSQKLSKKGNKEEEILVHSPLKDKETLLPLSSANTHNYKKIVLIEPGTKHWNPGISPQINKTLKKFPQLELLWDDEKFHVSGNKGKIVYRCTEHPIVVNWTNTTHYYHTSKNPKEDKGDGLPAYCTLVKTFIGKERTFCCAYGLILQRKADGYYKALKLLEERGNSYGSKYTIEDIKSPSEWRGKRAQRKGKEFQPQFKCEKHQFVTFYPYERLLLHASTFCVYCRENYRNIAVSPLKVRENNKKHKGPWHKFYRKKSMNLWNRKCAITSLNFKEDFEYLLEIHHLNCKEFYPNLKTKTIYNSVCLSKPIHYAYHYAFLGSFDLSYDEKAKKENLRNQANILTFLFFLQQLSRDFKTKHTNSLLNLVQKNLSDFYKEAQEKNAVLEGSPIITLENVEKLFFKLRNDGYFDLWKSDPNSTDFIAKYKANK